MKRKSVRKHLIVCSLSTPGPQYLSSPEGESCDGEERVTVRCACVLHSCVHTRRVPVEFAGHTWRCSWCRAITGPRHIDCCCECPECFALPFAEVADKADPHRNLTMNSTVYLPKQGPED